MLVSASTAFDCNNFFGTWSQNVLSYSEARSLHSFRSATKSLSCLRMIRLTQNFACTHFVGTRHSPMDHDNIKQ